MEKEIAINLSSHIYNALIADMRRFKFYNKKGIPNKSGFVSKIIINYDLFAQDRESTINLNLDNKYKSILNPEQLSELKDYVNGLFQFASYDDTDRYLHNKRIYLKPTKENIKALLYMNDNILQHTDASRYLRSIINEYISKPSYERSRIIFVNELNLIYKALTNDNLLAFNINNIRTTVHPYLIYFCEKKEIYIVICYDFENQITRFYDITDISYINILPNKKQLTKKQEKAINNAIDEHFSL